MRRRQAGTATLESAIAGGTALMVLFGCIEISRALYVWNTVGESTRRAAHLAAICPMNDPAIAAAALFGDAGGGTAKVLPGLTASMVTVTYSDASGVPTGVLGSVAYVTVAITGYTHTLAIPFVGADLAVPAFATTVPSESLGWVPGLNTFTCIGT